MTMQMKTLFTRKMPGFTRICTRMLMTILAASLVTGLAGCHGKPQPPALAVSGYLDSLKTLDTEAGNAFLLNPTVAGDLFLNGHAATIPSKDPDFNMKLQSSMRKIYSSMTYRIKSTLITGPAAVVAVEVTVPDLTALESDLADIALGDASGTPAEQDLLITQTLMDALQIAASTSTARVTHTVRLDVKQVDGIWKIMDQTILGRALIGNINGLLIPSA